MKTHLRLIAALLIAAPGLAFAQADPHHPTDSAPAQAQPQPQAQAQTMSPEMMPMMMQMMQSHMGMMQMMHGMQMMQMMQMMQGTMGQGGMGQGMMQGGMGGNMPVQGGMSEVGMAYMAAMSKMDAPMMQAVQDPDPDVAFMKAMIPHHQSAIDMARVVLEHGDDEEVKALANQIIAAQEKEIAEMETWLRDHLE